MESVMKRMIASLLNNTPAGTQVHKVNMPQTTGYPCIVVQPISRNLRLLDTGFWQVEFIIHWHLVVARLDLEERLEGLDELILAAEEVYEGNPGWTDEGDPGSEVYDSEVVSTRFIGGGYSMIFNDTPHYGATMELRGYAEIERGSLG